MQREVNPLNLYIEILSQLFNTPGTEIAPRSNEVGEYFQYDRFSRHGTQYTRRYSNCFLN